MGVISHLGTVSIWECLLLCYRRSPAHLIGRGCVPATLGVVKMTFLQQFQERWIRTELHRFLVLLVQNLTQTGSAGYMECGCIHRLNG